MEDLFGQIECRSKSDSTVMRILRSAMDKTHEKLQFKDGPIEFLHERTTFYELAAILVEGGLNIVQEETDVLEGGCNKVLSDLMEIRQWLQGRIQDMKQLIVDKDSELTERLENESMLRQALDLKDRELVYLHEKLEPGRTKMERSTEGDIFKLKSSVDQQVLNIKQKLEDEKKILTTERRTRRSRVSSPNLSFDFLDKERTGSLVFKEDEFFRIDNFYNVSRLNQNVLIKGMSSDIDILKETLDLAFGRMQSAEMLPLEKQWRWTVERDIESVMVKGFISELQGNFDVQVKKKVSLLKDNLFYFIDEKDLFTRNDVHEKGFSVRRTTSEPDLDISYTENLLVDVAEDDRSHHVAKMIKNHESIICKQREQYKWLTREGSSSRIKKDKDNNRQERRIQDALTRLDNFTKRNHEFADERCVRYKNAIQERRIPNNDMKTNRSSAIVDRFEVEIEKLQEERDGLCFQISVMEDIYQLLLKSLMKDVSCALCCEDTENCLQESIESRLKEDIYMVFFREMDASALESFLREDVYQFVIIGAVKDMHVQLDFQERTPRSRRLNADNFQEGTPRSRKLGADGDESLIQKLDSLLKCLEAEEDLMLKASLMIKEHSVNNSLVILNCEEMDERNAIEWLITDDESTFSSVSDKLERALQQLYTSKELLVELQQSLEISDDFGEYYPQMQFNNILNIECDQQDDQPSQSDNVLAIIMQFHRTLANVEHMLHENLESKCLRLEILKREVDTLTQPVAWIRTRKLLYEKAFISRCHNLKLAETEVDLLGDQVESLLYLLERIYAVLNRNATVLCGYFEVYDILKLIKIELNNGRSCKPKS